MMTGNPLGTGYSKEAAVVGARTLRSDTTKPTSVEKIINTVISTLSVSSEEQTVEFGSVDSNTAKSVLSHLEETSALRLAIYTISSMHSADK